MRTGLPPFVFLLAARFPERTQEGIGKGPVVISVRRALFALKRGGDMTLTRDELVACLIRAGELEVSGEDQA